LRGEALLEKKRLCFRGEALFVSPQSGCVEERKKGQKALGKRRFCVRF
jgi:hypothetical protein